METFRLTWHDATCSGTRVPEVPFQVKFTKMPLVNPRLTESQSWVKIIPKQQFSCFYIKPELLGDFCQLWPTLTKFNSRLTPRGTRNPNIDTTVRMSWDLYHCKYYQIPFPTTIHGSKSELKRLRYPENHTKRVSMLPETITFDPTVVFSISLVF